MEVIPKRLHLLLLGLFALLLTGCSWTDYDQPHLQGDTCWLDEEHAIGQTFIAQHGGINGVEIWLAPGESGNGTIYFHLRSKPGDTLDIATASLPVEMVQTPDFYLFSFSPIPSSTGSYYYAFWEIEGNGSLQVGEGGESTYINGALYLNHLPQNRQTTFRLSYDLLYTIVDLGHASLQGLGLLLTLTVLYVLPGWALLSWLSPKVKQPWLGKLGLSIGLSLSIYPLIMMWTDLIGLHLGALYAWLPALIGTGFAIRRLSHASIIEKVLSIKRWYHSSSFLPDATFLLVIGLTFFSRLLPVRTLDIPMWGDSYQHSMIVQLLIDHGGLFREWSPYAPMQSFTYHFGFHAAAAAFHWITGISAPQSVLWLGQLLNAVAATLVLYPLTFKVTRNRWAGAITAIIAGLLMRMPMFYVNWGRYTQLTGQAILPTAVALSWNFLSGEHKNIKPIAAWITIGGLALAHYRILIFYLVFLAAWEIVHFSPQGLWQQIKTIVGLLIGGLVLAVPWFLRLFAGYIITLLTMQITTSPSQLSDFAKHYNSIGPLSLYMSYTGWILMWIAAGISLWKRSKKALLIILWWFLLAIATNPQWLKLPGSGVISNFALGIAIYIPASIILSHAIIITIETYYPDCLSSRTVQRLIGAGLVLTSLAGTYSRLHDVEIKTHALVTRPDLIAMQWIESNIPPGSIFLINSMPAYGGSRVVGNDGGWWLPLLAHRANSVPPLTYGFEEGPTPDYQDQVLTFNLQIYDSDLSSPSVLNLLQEHHINYVYLGQQQGRVNNTHWHIPPSELIESPHYQLLYHQDMVYIFAVNP